MRKVPEELTPQLLGLILEEEVKTVSLQINHNIVEYGTNDFYLFGYQLNIDTLTRLMKEWCYKQGFDVIVYQNVDIYVVAIFKKGYFFIDRILNCCEYLEYQNHSYSEFEAALLATRWVVTKKGKR